ncbi:glycosyltransferase family 4 protein [Solirubrobacter soli]|uniref:glycosyltransferase family 4 protein n=1 Tax=Solirubrobacter soli TaxID=363832 RepID=UPI00040BF07C|nr:glycosyltransferase family 4 protein [Solirubrobacter soli]
MRVLYSFPTRLGTSGIGTTAWHGVTGLTGIGVTVDVTAGSVERPADGATVRFESMRVGPLKLPYRALGLERAMAYHDARTARLIARHADRYDVVHTWPQGAERTLRAARAAGVPAVLERPNAHTAFAAEAVLAETRRIGVPIDPSSPHLVEPARLEREEREYAAATALLCPSDFVARTHREHGTPPEKLLRHRYGYDPARFPVGPPRPPGRPFTAAFVGRMEPRKGLHTALEAWIAAGLHETDARFVAAGSIDAGYDVVLAPLMREARVEHHGFHPDPGALMREADVLVLPSVEEGSALVTYEARGSGCVLVVSDHSGAQCTDGVDALVHPAGDVAALTAHLATLAGDPARLAQLREASLAGIGDLTWEAAAHALAAAYAAAAKLQAQA